MHLRRLALLSSLALAAACTSDGERTTTAVAQVAEPDEAVMAFLTDELAGQGSTSPKMFVARTIDGGEAHARITLAYLTDADWCGSGGCPLVVVESKPEGAVLLGRITITRPPIRVLTSRTNGMPDLGVLVCGGGIVECYEAVLPFDGRRYASNPTVPPARRPPVPSDGEVVISEEMVRLAFAGQP
ncbi:hypothetical protein N0B44_06940 [Roseibacterium beibuensis]|uniref:hypothetical protein n=1 Tax=[Roseibacterium] beibuensis TaxID=1193142 RepID=UPI00217DB966|nr:hypothetical protein [Roseibacterium beibuensis]MCS6622639.1 hypothetical protein [Roseibacterium beibuensis]